MKSVPLREDGCDTITVCCVTCACRAMFLFLSLEKGWFKLLHTQLCTSFLPSYNTCQVGSQVSEKNRRRSLLFYTDLNNQRILLFSPTRCSHSVLQLLRCSVQVSAASQLFNQLHLHPASTCTLWICLLSSLPNLSLCVGLRPRCREWWRPTWTTLLCCTLISIIFFWLNRVFTDRNNPTNWVGAPELQTTVK